MVVKISSQQEECTNVEVYTQNDVLPITNESHIQGDVNLLPGVVKGPIPEGPKGSVVHEAAKVCSTYMWMHWGLGIPSRNLIRWSPSWRTGLQEGKLPPLQQ
jgi:hypothetical protein